MESSSDHFDENDNQYSDEVIDQDDDDRNQEEEQIDTSTTNTTKKVYKGNFSSTKDEDQYGCPYQTCGRKFVSPDMLKQHIERRHAPNISPQKAKTIPRDQIIMKEAPINSILKKDIQPKRFQEDKFNQSKMGFFQAAPRPVTSHGRQNAQMSSQQAQILRDMMGGAGQDLARRPQTAATTTKKDEQRIKKKIFTLEMIERKIEEDIEEFNNRRKGKNQQGDRVTKKMILESSQCDVLSEVQAIILREKNIEIFDDNKKDGFKLEDLVNCEAIYATHNLIRDIFGICQISTLVELNLSFNQIADIQPLEDLILLQKLWLNRNHILVIDPLKSLHKLEVLGLFNNEIFNDKKAIDVLEKLQNLKELSIDGNPVSANVRFKYEIIMRLKKLEILDEDHLKELDREIAEQFYIQNKIPFPNSGIIKKASESGTLQNNNFINDSQQQHHQFAEDREVFKENQSQPLKTKKSVKFQKQSIDDDGNTWMHDEIKKLEAKCAELIVENEDYKVKLQQKHYEQVYKENQRLKMELKNMYIIEEENRDLKEEYESLKSLTYEDKVRDLVEENKTIKKRNGMLLIQVSELQQRITELEKTKQEEILDYQKNMRSNLATQRPSTSAGAFMRKKEDMIMVNEDFLALQESAQDEFDKELDELIMKNQQRLNELQNDVKYQIYYFSFILIREVSKIVGEPVVNVRKLKTVRAVKGSTKSMTMKPVQTNDRAKALGADMIDENEDN